MSKYISLQEINPCLRLVGQEIPQNNLGPSRLIYDYEFIYCHRGSFSVLYDTHINHIKSGEILIIPPNIAHRLDYRQGIEVYWVHFDFYYHNNQENLGRYIASNQGLALSKSGYSPQYIRPTILIAPNLTLPETYTVSNPLQTRDLFLELIKLSAKRPYDWSLQSKVHLNRLLFDTFSNLRTVPGQEDSSDQLISSIQSYLMDHAYRKVSSAELSNQFHYHPDTLNRLFKKNTNLTLQQYQQKIRLQKVKELLSETDFSIDHIAFLCHYNDRSHLIKTFKKSEGFSPTDFRKSL